MTTDAPAATRARRVTLVALTAITIGAGLLVHRFGEGMVGDIVGDALYAVMIYLFVAVVFPRRPAAWRATGAVAVCFAIELLQLTGLPRAWSAVFPPVQLVFGSGFDPRDLLVYASAVLLALITEGVVGRMLRAKRPMREDARGRPPEGERPLI
ncbi:DUF2809 domain-containing protein [Microbacterium sp. LWH12-1.2]|uniref:ribosomal maturation YjgA family protein n=1 Tax=Microbacterium sp. LWH12-1.2 TaxID=3135259 RepID=UPI0034316BE3